MVEIMEIAELIRVLSEINEGFSDDYIFNEQFEITWKLVSERCKFDSNALFTICGNIIDKSFSPNITTEWNYIISSITLFYMLKCEVDKSLDEVFSVQQTKCLKKYFKNLVHIGICSKLLPSLPVYEKPTETYDNGDIFYNYQILKATTLALCDFLKYPKLRLIILPQYLRPVLVACYQIAYCPLKKPSVEPKECEKNAITEDVYNKLLNDKQQFEDILQHLQQSIHAGIFVKETMGTFLSSAPPWFKKRVSQKLTSIIKSKNGVENIAIALLDASTNDSNHTWKILDIITKLILSCRSFPDFKENICGQIIQLLPKVSDDILVLERIYIHCTRTLYKMDPELAKDVLVRPIVSNILYFTYRDHKFQENEDITIKIQQTIRLLHSLFVEENVELMKLPITLITPIINVLFRIFSIIRQGNLKSTSKDLNDLLESYLCGNFDNISIVYDSILFDIPSDTILVMRKDIFIAISDQGLRVNYNKHSTSYSISESLDCLLQVIKNKTDLRLKLFGYFLGCLINKAKYFKKANDELMNIEDTFVNDHMERYLVVYKNLSDLAEDKEIQKSITKDPEKIIKYCETVLNKVIELNTHKLVETDTEAYQTLFIVLMILQNLTDNCPLLKRETYKNILEPLRKICQETSDKETKSIVNEILVAIDKGNVKPTRISVEDIKTELEKALEDICDPLLPTRGHGLMILAKLVKKKDKDVMERKQYVLNILKQNLKSDDSYIYLSAINGLSALADVFPDTVLNILCEEYSDTTKQTGDDGHEVRMKLGESLVRVTKILGEMAPKYKTLLLNTFLNGVRDEDDLIRASSLSNLGEVCRVLGYNLGTIITEVLVCVHSVISTDKSPQARRAAVTVLRQLFLGLEAGMIAFLKEDILPIYRTLKQIYNNDEDDLMRLQAQLALEELNENMKNFVLPDFKLHDEKKIIMLD